MHEKPCYQYKKQWWGNVGENNVIVDNPDPQEAGNELTDKANEDRDVLAGSPERMVWPALSMEQDPWASAWNNVASMRWDPLRGSAT